MTLPDLQASVVDLLRADPWLVAAGIETVAEDKGDIAAEIDRALASLGACVVAIVGEFRPEAQDGGLLSGVAVVLLHAVELPAVNRQEGRKSALAIASRLAAAASGWSGARCAGVRLVDAGADTLAYEVSVEVSTTLDGGGSGDQ